MIPFTTNTLYFARVVGNHQRITLYRVERRTERSVWLSRIITQRTPQAVHRRSIIVVDDHEQCLPVGRYAKAPVLNSDAILTVGAYKDLIKRLVFDAIHQPRRHLLHLDRCGLQTHCCRLPTHRACAMGGQ